MLKQLSVAFAAGGLGGLLNSLTVWVFGALGITTMFGVSIAPPLTHAWLYPRIVWGGLWGLLFLLPFWRHSWPLRGLVFSLAPTAAQLFIVFPFQAQKGYAGLELGTLTPLFVVFFNLIWGLAGSAWIKACEDGGS